MKRECETYITFVSIFCLSSEASFEMYAYCYWESRGRVKKYGRISLCDEFIKTFSVSEIVDHLIDT